MRKFLFFAMFVIALALVTINLPMVKHAHAAEESKVDVYNQQKQLVKSVVFKIGVPYYVVNGQTPGIKMDVAPLIKDDRTFVPVRFLGNALGLDDSRITWDDGTQTATLKGNATLQMTIGQAQVVSNGQAKAIDVAPVLTSDRTFLPARYVAEGLGYQVGWDEATQTVICWPQGEAKPDVSAAVDYLNRVQQPQEDGKPVIARQLEQMFGVTMVKYGSGWTYQPAREETIRNKDRSYYTLWHYSDDGYVGVSVAWDLINSDIRTVSLDLSPIEKVLNWKFPDQPEKVGEIMDYARQVAEHRQKVGRTGLSNKTFYLNGYKVLIGSVDNAFVSAHISKN